MPVLQRVWWMHFYMQSLKLLKDFFLRPPSLTLKQFQISQTTKKLLYMFYQFSANTRIDKIQQLDLLSKKHYVIEKIMFIFFEVLRMPFTLSFFFAIYYKFIVSNKLINVKQFPFFLQLLYCATIIHAELMRMTVKFSFTCCVESFCYPIIHTPFLH